MSVTQKDIERLTIILSKIAIEETKLVDDINSILKYIELLNEVDTKGIEATVNVIASEKKTKLRDDIVAKKQEPRDLLACSNQKVIQDQIAISNIMK